MFLGVLDKTIIIGYLLHCDVVRFLFFSLFYLQYTIILVIAPSKHRETVSPDTYFGKFNNTRVSMTLTCGKSSNSGLEKTMKIMETLSYRARVIMT